MITTKKDINQKSNNDDEDEDDRKNTDDQPLSLRSSDVLGNRNMNRKSCVNPNSRSKTGKLIEFYGEIEEDE